MTGSHGGPWDGHNDSWALLEDWGTLIIIAIIVAVFSQDAGRNLKPEISDLQSVVQELKEAVDSQTIEIQELRTKIDELIE